MDIALLRIEWSSYHSSDVFPVEGLSVSIGAPVDVAREERLSALGVKANGIPASNFSQ